MQTNSTRFLVAGIIASPETGNAPGRPWSIPDERSTPGAAPARSAPGRLRTPPARASRSHRVIERGSRPLVGYECHQESIGALVVLPVVFRVPIETVPT